MKYWIKIYEKRFWKYVNKDGPIISHMKTKCWIWTGSKTSRKYGQFNTIKLKKKGWLSHRFMWIMTYGKIINKLFVLHKCDNPPCINPKHLFLGTQKDNIQDAVRKGRTNCGKGEKHGSKTHPEKIPKGEKHSMAKLNENDVINIRKLSNNNHSIVKIAKKYKMSCNAISKIINRTGWKHVN